MKEDQENLPAISNRGQYPKGKKHNFGKEGTGIVNFWVSQELKDGFHEYCRSRGLVMQWVFQKILEAVIRGELDDLIYNPDAFKRPSVADYYELKKNRRLP